MQFAKQDLICVRSAVHKKYTCALLYRIPRAICGTECAVLALNSKLVYRLKLELLKLDNTGTHNTDQAGHCVQPDSSEHGRGLRAWV